MNRAFPASRGFTLLEVALVMLILTILVASLAVPLGAQVAMRHRDETRRILEDAREAVLGFAVTHGRLPCPATADSRGEERFAVGGDARNGSCATFHDGFLPASSLGFAPLDREGFARDGWGAAPNRIRYAVFGGAIGGVDHPMTRADGLRQATLAGLGAAPDLLVICATGIAANATGCGPAVNRLTRRAAFVLLSLGPSAAGVPPPGTDEARNLDGDGVFVSREASMARGNEFDDELTWAPATVLASRLVAAGRLP